MFEQGNDINAYNYDILVQPLFFDADTGLPQKVK